MNTKQKIVTSLVKVYRKLPCKPMGGVLRNAYYKFLRSNVENRTVVKSVDGIYYELDLTEIIDSAIFFNQNREPDTSNALKRLCKPGMVVFDIGANVGSHTLPIAKSVGCKGLVYAFEPVPWALNKLKKNLDLNDFKNVFIQPIALSDCENENAEFSLRASFKTSSGKPVNEDGGLNENWWGACENINVKVNTLDNFVARENVSSVDVIKIDVDGFEVKVLRGAADTLKRYTPSIVVELAPSWLADKGDSVEELVAMLLDMGYGIFDETTFEEILDIGHKLKQLKTGAGLNVVFQQK